MQANCIKQTVNKSKDKDEPHRQGKQANGAKCDPHIPIHVVIGSLLSSDSLVVRLAHSFQEAQSWVCSDRVVLFITWKDRQIQRTEKSCENTRVPYMQNTDILGLKEHYI